MQWSAPTSRLQLREQETPRRGNCLLLAAYELESQAAHLAAQKNDSEPTRSILHRSAASLALDCGLSREAERLICEALGEIRLMPSQTNSATFLNRYISPGILKYAAFRSPKPKCRCLWQAIP